MSGLSGPAEITTSVELKGHILDSLTLSKVMDQVQQLGGNYRLNDIRVGTLKNDVSAIQMTLLAPDDATMSTLLEALAPYGIRVQHPQDIQTVTCEHAGQLPEQAFVAQMPQKALIGGEWVSIENGGSWVLVVQGNQPKLMPLAQTRPGDQLVSGGHGLRW